jgi:hypothetical protein
MATRKKSFPADFQQAFSATILYALISHIYITTSEEWLVHDEYKAGVIIPGRQHRQ